MVEHAVTIDHAFKSGTSELLVSVNAVENRIDVKFRMSGSGEIVELSRTELAELADLFGQVNDFLNGKPQHKSAFAQDEAEPGPEALTGRSVGQG